jgi:ferredoxin
MLLVALFFHTSTHKTPCLLSLSPPSHIGCALCHHYRFDGWRCPDEGLPTIAAVAAAQQAAAAAAAAAVAAADTPPVPPAAPAVAAAAVAPPAASAGTADAQAAAAEAERAPYVFPACGHVHAYSRELRGGACPMCRCVVL